MLCWKIVIVGLIGIVLEEKSFWIFFLDKKGNISISFEFLLIGFVNVVVKFSVRLFLSVFEMIGSF